MSKGEQVTEEFAEAVRKVTPPSGFNLTVPKTRPPHATWEYSWPPRVPELGRRLDQGFYAARSYSLMRPPRTGRRLIRCWDGPAGVGGEHGGCHRRTVPGVTSRCIRRLRGWRRISAPRTAWSAQFSRGRGLVRRSTVTSCRSTSSSMSLDVVDRPGRTSQPQSRMKIRQSRRRDTAGHHVPRLALGALLQLTAEADFWHPTAPLHEPGEAIDLTARIKRDRPSKA